MSSILEPLLESPWCVRRALLVVNPAAREVRRALPGVLEAFRVAGVECLVEETRGPAHATDLVRERLSGLRLKRFTARITVDGVTVQVETSSVLVANFGLVLGDLVCFGEQIGHRDGLLSVCVYSPRSKFDAMRIFWRMLRGEVSYDRCVRILAGSAIRIETDLPRSMQADGELLGLTPVEIRVEPNAVRLLTPSAPHRRWALRRAATSGVSNNQSELS